MKKHGTYCAAIAALTWTGAIGAFPSAEPVIGERPMLLIVSNDTTRGAMAQESEWYRSRVFGGEAAPNVRDYFIAQSRGWFRYREAATIDVADDGSAELDRLAGVANWNNQEGRRIARAIYLAAQSGFNFMEYDANGDGQIATDELTILVVQNYVDGDRGIEVPNMCVSAPGTKVCTNGVLLGHEAAFSTYAHEVAHSIDPAAIDLYGMGDACLSHRATLMSCSGEFSVFLDPWHRARYSWQGPVLQASADDVGQTFVITALQNPSFEPEVLTVMSPNGREAMTFEMRGVYGKEYDDVAAAGRIVFGWYSLLDQNGEPANLLALKRRTRTIQWNPPRARETVPVFPRFPTTQSSSDRPTLPIERTDVTRIFREPALPTWQALVRSRGFDRALFTLGPIGNCVLDPLSIDSRGKVADLGNGAFLLRWTDGSTTTFYTETRAHFRVAIRWEHGDGGERTCSM